MDETQFFLRDGQAADLETLLQLNNAATPAVNALDLDSLNRLVAKSCHFRVGVLDGATVAFLLAICPGEDYASDNYRWFEANYDQFIYIDRVVVGSAHRGRGIGKVFYADVHAYAESRAPRLACEVNLQPKNDISLVFHGTTGFNEVGRRHNKDGKTVSMLVKELPDYAFITARYPNSA